MNKTRKFIQDNKESFETYAGFSDYDVLFVAIDNKKTADHSIEACKALIEGVSKTILMKVDLKSLEITKNLDGQQQENIRNAVDQIISNNIKFPFLFKQAITSLSAYHHACEKDFLLELGNKFCVFISKVRDRKGDVSHGRVAPRQDKSSMELANIVEKITDILLFHMLEVFSLIDFSINENGGIEWVIENSFVIKTIDELKDTDEDELMYRGFNSSLDDLNPLDGKLRYSLALYQQSYEDYQIQFTEFVDIQEMDNL